MRSSSEICVLSKDCYNRIQCSKSVKLISIVVVFLLISVTWSGTIPTGKGENGEEPVAVIGIISHNPLPVQFEGFNTPFWVDGNEDGFLDIIAYKRGTSYLYYGKYVNESEEDDHYQWFPLLNLPDSFDSLTRGGEEEDDWMLENIVPVMTNLGDIYGPLEDLIITNSWGFPKWFKKTEVNTTTDLPEFEYVADLPDVTSCSPLSFGDLNSDGKPDIITTSSENDLIYYENIGTPEEPAFESPETVTNSTGQIITFDEGFNIIPYLVQYDNDTDYDLIITSDPLGEVLYYENTNTNGTTYEWTEREPDIFLASTSIFPVIQLVNFNEEMSGLTGNNYGSEDNVREIMTSSSEVPELFCFFNWTFENGTTLPMAITEGEEFNLTASMSSDPENENLTYQWDFDDGNTSQEMVVSHVYDTVDSQNQRNYSIKLTVEDEQTNTDEIEVIVTVLDAVPETVISGNRYPEESEITVFSSNDSNYYENDSIFKQEWDIDYNKTLGFQADSEYDNMSWVNLSWDDEGPEWIALKLTDDDGSEDMMVETIHVENARPLCQLSLNESSLVTTNSEITNESEFSAVEVYAYNVSDPGPNDTIETYRWIVCNKKGSWYEDFFNTSENDSFELTFGNTSEDAFCNSGTYYIYLQVQDNDGSWSHYSNVVEYTIGDEAPISADFSANTSTANEGASIKFTPTATTPFDDISGYEWDFDYDGENFTLDDYSSRIIVNGNVTYNITHDFEVNDGNLSKDFDVAVRARDEDGSYSPVASLGYGNEITINDTGFYGNGSDYEPGVEAYAYEKSWGWEGWVSYGESAINEGDGLKFEANFFPKNDEVEQMEWDFDYINANFTVDHVSETLGCAWWMNEVRYTASAYHVFNSSQGGVEYNDSANFTVAVRAVDSDGTVSDTITLEYPVWVNDSDPVANITAAPLRKYNGEYYAPPGTQITFDASASLVSPTDGGIFEWDFDYDGMNFIPIPPTEDLSENQDCSVVLKDFPEEIRTIALRISEPDGNEENITTLTITFEPPSDACLVVRPSPNQTDRWENYCIVTIEEDEEFRMDSTHSDPNPEIPPEPVSYYWKYQDNWEGPYQENDTDDKFYNVTTGLPADNPNSLEEMEFYSWQGTCRYQEYKLQHKVAQDGSESIDNWTIFVRDVEPDNLLTVESVDDEEYWSRAINGKVYTAPGMKVRFNATEHEDYKDAPVEYLWDVDYSEESPNFVPLSPTGIENLFWNSEGDYVLAIKKTDSDESVVIRTMKVMVRQDTDLDGIPDEDDMDDDGDGIDDANEVHTKVFKTKKTYVIEDGATTCVNLAEVGVSYISEIVSATANIGIKHQYIEDLSVNIGIIGIGAGVDVNVSDHDPNTDYDTLYETIDLLGVYSTPRFQGSSLWYLKVEDSINNDTLGKIEYFEIEIVHKSDPLDTDTDNDGLSDFEELTYGDDGVITDPCDNDTDDDGLSDLEELYLNTNPTLPDTDGDGTFDGADIDPLHDVVLKIEIYEVGVYNDADDDVFFKGTMSCNDEVRTFETAHLGDVYQNQNEGFFNFTEGVYYWNIEDKNADDYCIDVGIQAWDTADDDGDDQLDLDGDSGSEANFRYYPNNEGTSRIGNPKSGSESQMDNEFGTVSSEDGYTCVELDGALTGGSGDEDVKAKLKLSLSYADKIDTILIANESLVSENEDGEWRYVGEDQFYLFLIERSYYDDGGEYEHAIVVPKSSFFASNFYSKSQSTGLDNISYIPTEHSIQQFITRDNDSNSAPVEIEGVIKLENLWPTSGIEDLIDDLTTNASGNVTGKEYDLKPYCWYNDDGNNDTDYIHSIGLPSAVLNMIPNAKKVTESANVDHPEDDGGFRFSVDYFVDGAKYWVGEAALFIKNLATNLANMGMGLLYGLADAAQAAGEALYDALTALYEWVKGVILNKFKWALNTFQDSFESLTKSLIPWETIYESISTIEPSNESGFTPGDMESFMTTFSSNYCPPDFDMGLPGPIEDIFKYASKFFDAIPSLESILMELFLEAVESFAGGESYITDFIDILSDLDGGGGRSGEGVEGITDLPMWLGNQGGIMDWLDSFLNSEPEYPGVGDALNGACESIDYWLDPTTSILYRALGIGNEKIPKEDTSGVIITLEYNKWFPGGADECQSWLGSALEIGLEKLTTFKNKTYMDGSQSPRMAINFYFNFGGGGSLDITLGLQQESDEVGFELAAFIKKLQLVDEAFDIGFTPSIDRSTRGGLGFSIACLEYDLGVTSFDPRNFDAMLNYPRPSFVNEITGDEDHIPTAPEIMFELQFPQLEFEWLLLSLG